MEARIRWFAAFAAFAGSPVRWFACQRGTVVVEGRMRQRPRDRDRDNFLKDPPRPLKFHSDVLAPSHSQAPPSLASSHSHLSIDKMPQVRMRSRGERRDSPSSESESAQSERLRLRLVFSFFPGWLRASGVPNVYYVSVVVYVLREGPLRRICSGCGFENRSREGPARRENERRDSRARRVYTPRIHIHTYPSTHDSRLTTDASSTTSTDDCHRLQGPYAWSPRVHCCQAGAVWSPCGVRSL